MHNMYHLCVVTLVGSIVLHWTLLGVWCNPFGSLVVLVLHQTQKIGV